MTSTGLSVVATLRMRAQRGNRPASAQRNNITAEMIRLRGCTPELYDKHLRIWERMFPWLPDHDVCDYHGFPGHNACVASAYVITDFITIELDHHLARTFDTIPALMARACDQFLYTKGFDLASVQQYEYIYYGIMRMHAVRCYIGSPLSRVLGWAVCIYMAWLSGPNTDMPFPVAVFKRIMSASSVIDAKALDYMYARPSIRSLREEILKIERNVFNAQSLIWSADEEAAAVDKADALCLTFKEAVNGKLADLGRNHGLRRLVIYGGG